MKTNIDKMKRDELMDRIQKFHVVSYITEIENSSVYLVRDKC